MAQRRSGMVKPQLIFTCNCLGWPIGGGARTSLTRTLTILVLGCLLIVGAAVASILGRNSVPQVLFSSFGEHMNAPGPVANREGKKDRLAVAESFTGPDRSPAVPVFTDPLRQAFASDSPVAVPPPSVAAPMVIPSQQPAKPKLVAKPTPQKNYTLLSDMQIAAIKGRLNLTAAQEPSWPAVEAALRAVARKIHDSRQSNPSAGSPPIDPSSAEVQQLKSAAMPLLVQLREDQKREVRSLARIIGLERVASQI